MKQRILIVGFPRSGTTLTRSIVLNHPQVGTILFEKWVLNKCNNLKDVYKKFPFFENNRPCGAKVIYAKRVIGKVGTSTQTIVDYCKKWNEFFGRDSKIVQIVRHPYDSLNSLVLSKRRTPLGPIFGSVYREYLDYIPQYTLGIAELPNTYTFKYEDLLLNHEKTLKEICDHCGLDTDYKYQKKILEEKAFNHRKNKKLLFEFDEKLESVVDAFNQLDGVKYELPRFPRSVKKTNVKKYRG